MKKLLQITLTIISIAFASTTFAEVRVFELTTPHPEEIIEELHQAYGDKIRADWVQQRLVVVGSKQQLDEVSTLLLKLDPKPSALRLTIRDQPPSDDKPGTVTYSSNNGGYTIDTVEGALVVLDSSEIAQQIGAAGSDNGGWWVAIDNRPVRIQSLTLQVRVQGGRNALVLVSYAKEENQQRRVYGNTVTGELGGWIPLLPQPSAEDPGTISSGPKRGSQLYVQVRKNFNKARR